MNNPSKILLMIRAQKQAEDFAAELAVSNAVIYAPMVRIDPMNADDDLPHAGTVIFTSSNAVRFYADRAQNRTSGVLCVGSATDRAATAYGFQVMHTFETAKQLVAFVGENLKVRTPILYPRAETVSVDIAGDLAELGHSVRDAILYRQTFLPLSDEGINAVESLPLIIPILSREIAKRFRDVLVSAKPRDLTIVCISAPVAAIFDDLGGFSVEIAQKPTRSALIHQVKASLSAEKSA